MGPSFFPWMCYDVSFSQWEIYCLGSLCCLFFFGGGPGCKFRVFTTIFNMSPYKSLGLTPRRCKLHSLRTPSKSRGREVCHVLSPFCLQGCSNPLEVNHNYKGGNGSFLLLQPAIAHHVSCQGKMAQLELIYLLTVVMFNSNVNVYQRVSGVWQGATLNPSSSLASPWFSARFISPCWPKRRPRPPKYHSCVPRRHSGRRACGDAYRNRIGWSTRARCFCSCF